MIYLRIKIHTRQLYLLWMGRVKEPISLSSFASRTAERKDGLERVATTNENVKTN